MGMLSLSSLILRRALCSSRQPANQKQLHGDTMARCLLVTMPTMYLREYMCSSRVYVCVCAGVAEQFAIAEAKLRAWSSVDGDESNDDSYDEDFLPANEPNTQSTGTHTHTHSIPQHHNSCGLAKSHYFLHIIPFLPNTSSHTLFLIHLSPSLSLSIFHCPSALVFIPSQLFFLFLGAI